MKKIKRIMVYTRINGIEKIAIDNTKAPKQTAKAGLVVNREFHEALGLRGVR